MLRVYPIVFAGILLSLLSTLAALNLQGFTGHELSPYAGTVLPSDRVEASSPIIQGTCYSPFHNAEYPLNGGSAVGLDLAMDTDFSIMKKYVTVVRTYYSSYYGYSVASHAARHGIQLYLGVFMTDESWYGDQVSAAIAAVKNYPESIKAILVGNENIYPAGPYSPDEVLRRISTLRAQILSETGRIVNIGTVQRHNEWTASSSRSAILALANGCDILGVNIYPFFDASYTAREPLAMLNGAWNNMLTIFPSDKVRLTEIGFPTAGSSPSFAPNNVPSVSNAFAFYSAFLKWSPVSGGQEVFWFMFFDRRPDDNTMEIELEKYFGFYTWNRLIKLSNYPRAILNPTLPPTSVPTSAAPSTSISSTSLIYTAQVCRVHKVYSFVD
ncbi:glycoside partial [Plasmopara halstedii]|uniref:glucan endo-1,3-beta-D-glucosidase n=1 Tax=Plasmopara halstedii TaxID=4781 RepID=A0A0P1B5Y5_PLAHL|nr:glycoside partial [Plasmopara halstedii]CEG49945.1 glycoside partial [Plasmopara halstedii]